MSHFMRWHSIIKVVIYHKPPCGASRKVLAVLRESVREPGVVDHLKIAAGCETLSSLLKRMSNELRQLLSRRGTPVEEMDLKIPALSDVARFKVIEKQLILINWPIVVFGDKVTLCRPYEIVRDLIANASGGGWRQKGR